MCSQYLIQTRLSDLRRHFGIVVPSGWEDEMSFFVSPYQKAPVLVQREGRVEAKLMNFSLIPSWSKMPRMKFSSHNARLDSLAQKPTWIKPTKNRRALVPLTAFVEPIYTDAYAGNMVEFFAPNHEVLYAAAVCDEWIDPKTGEILESFAIVTGDPYPFVKSVGHDRSPLFLREEDAQGWIDESPKDAAERVTYLSEHRWTPDLQCKVFRPLKPGWEKRVKSKAKVS